VGLYPDSRKKIYWGDKELAHRDDIRRTESKERENSVWGTHSLARLSLYGGERKRKMPSSIANEARFDRAAEGETDADNESGAREEDFGTQVNRTSTSPTLK